MVDSPISIEIEACPADSSSLNGPSDDNSPSLVSLSPGPVSPDPASVPVTLRNVAEGRVLRPLWGVALLEGLRERLLGDCLLPVLPVLANEDYLALEAMVDTMMLPLRVPTLVSMAGNLDSVGVYWPWLQRVRLFWPDTFSPRIMDLCLDRRCWVLGRLGRLLQEWCEHTPLLMSPQDVKAAGDDLKFLESLPGRPLVLGWLRRRYTSLAEDGVFGTIFR